MNRYNYGETIVSANWYEKGLTYLYKSGIFLVLNEICETEESIRFKLLGYTVVFSLKGLEVDSATREAMLYSMVAYVMQ